MIFFQIVSFSTHFHETGYLRVTAALLGFYTFSTISIATNICSWALSLESPETVRVYFECHNFLYMFAMPSF